MLTLLCCRFQVFENEFYVVHKQDGFYRARVLRKMDHGYHMKLLDFDLDLMATEEDLWPLKFDPETNVGYTLAKQLANLGPYDFISGDYKYGFTVPAYTMIKLTLLYCFFYSFGIFFVFRQSRNPFDWSGSSHRNGGRNYHRCHDSLRRPEMSCYCCSQNLRPSFIFRSSSRECLSQRIS